MHMGGNWIYQREENSNAKEVDTIVMSGKVGRVVDNRMYTVKEYSDNHLLKFHPNSSSSSQMKL